MLIAAAMGTLRSVFLLAALAVGCGGRAVYEGGGAGDANLSGGSGGASTGTDVSSGTNNFGDRGAGAAGSTSGYMGIPSGDTTTVPADASVAPSDDGGD